MTSEANFETVTETPGWMAHHEQIQALYTRYDWASKYCQGKKVIEVACGSCPGLGILAGNAESVLGCDIDETVLKYGREHYQDPKISIEKMDACQLEVPDSSFDTSICFESFYYFPDFNRFIDETQRILKPGGVFVGSSVNKEWHGFNPSPFSVDYYALDDIRGRFESRGFETEFWVAFEDDPDTLKARITATLRSAAVRLNLIPKTMKGKEVLKRLFYGQLTPLPHELTAGLMEPEPLRPFTDQLKLRNFKYFYFTAIKKS